MKDTIVTARRKKIELITLLVCFVVSNLIHLYAIIAYHAPFTEMITSIFYIIIFTFSGSSSNLVVISFLFRRFPSSSFLIL